MYRSLNRSLVTFILLSYLLSWSFWLWPIHASSSILLGPKGLSLEIPLKALMRLLGDLGPGVAAVIVVGKDYGAQRLRELLTQLIPRGLIWIAPTVLAPAVILILTLGCTGQPVAELLSPASSARWLRVFAVNLPFAPFWEELGWRGYFLSELQTTRKPLTASIAVGVIWGLWHVPLYLRVKIAGSGLGVFPLCFFVLTLGLSILFSWVYNATKGSLAAVILFHASLNSSIIVFLGPAMSAAGLKPFFAVAVGIWLIALTLLVVAGTELSYEGREPHI